MPDLDTRPIRPSVVMSAGMMPALDLPGEATPGQFGPMILVRLPAALALLESRGEQVTKPLVVRLDGNNAEEGRRILDSAANSLVERVDTMDGAAQRAAELAAAGV